MGAVLCGAGAFAATPALANGWSTPTLIDPAASAAGSVAVSMSVSCVSSSFCAAVDSNVDALTYNGTSWSAPGNIDNSSTDGVIDPFYTGDGDIVSAVSCVSASFCIAVDGDGNFMKYDGAFWSAPVDIDPAEDLRSVSCVSTSFCVAVDDQDALTYNGTSWSTPSPFDSKGDLNSVSCVSTSLCAAVDEYGDAFTSNGRSWSKTGSLPAGNALDSVSCASASFCLAVGPNLEDVFRYDGTSWTGSSLAEHGPVFAVSCVSSAFCAAGGNDGVESYDGGSWSPLDNIDPSELYSLTSVSCPSVSFCVAVDNGGRASLYSYAGAVGPAFAQFVSRLVAGIRAKLGSIASIERAGGVKLKVVCPAAGSIAAAIEATVKGHRHKLASGTKRFSAAGTKVVAVTLSGAARALLRHVKRLKVKVTASFTPVHGKAVSISRPFTLT
ncbi:MAG: hypothetical protein ACRDL5_09040 [Solirubrobacteraceae bacterium]